MRRALFLCPSPFEVGTYFRAIAIARYLVRKGDYAVDLICTGDQDLNIHIDGVHVYVNATKGPNLTPMRGWNLRDIRRRVSHVKMQKTPYDLVYTFEYQPNVWYPGVKAAKNDQTAHFNDWCDWYAGRHHRLGGFRWLQRLDQWLEERPRSRVDHVSVICSSLFQRAKSIQVIDDRLSLVREGAERSEKIISRAQARLELGIESDVFLVVSMADSGHALLADSLRNLRVEKPHAELVILGNVRDIGAQTGVLLPGRVSNENLHLWLCAADVAWLGMPDNEINRGRLPHKIGHFRMYGLPLICTRVGDVVSLGDPGILFADPTGEDFAKQTSMLDLLTDERRTSSIIDAEKVFQWDRILAPLLEKIEAAIDRRKKII